MERALKNKNFNDYSDLIKDKKNNLKEEKKLGDSDDMTIINKVAAKSKDKNK